MEDKKIYKTIPIYEGKISEEEEDTTGVNLISLVEFPAIEIRGIAFEDHKESSKCTCGHNHTEQKHDGKLNLPPCHDNCKCEIINSRWKTEPDVCDYCLEQKQFWDDRNLRMSKFSSVPDQQILAGPFMVPDKMIYRNDDQGEYMVYVTKETIRQISNKFNRASNNKALNIDHEKRMVPGFIMENWIIESEEFDKSRMYGYNLPIGTWFGLVKIDDKQFWESEVRENGKQSFSIEGFLDMVLRNEDKMSKFSMDEFIDSLTEEEIKEITKDLLK